MEKIINQMRLTRELLEIVFITFFIFLLFYAFFVVSAQTEPQPNDLAFLSATEKSNTPSSVSLQSNTATIPLPLQTVWPMAVWIIPIASLYSLIVRTVKQRKKKRD